jgi:hypothetical protein
VALGEQGSRPQRKVAGAAEPTRSGFGDSTFRTTTFAAVAESLLVRSYDKAVGQRGGDALTLIAGDPSHHAPEGVTLVVCLSFG